MPRGQPEVPTTEAPNAAAPTTSATTANAIATQPTMCVSRVIHWAPIGVEHATRLLVFSLVDLTSREAGAEDLRRLLRGPMRVGRAGDQPDHHDEREDPDSHPRPAAKVHLPARTHHRRPPCRARVSACPDTFEDWAT